ncbi:MAG TPA: RsmE family RNA methyltransferase [Polyangiaceae bacterium]|nr:RsmE family RNA methyltransferase [Polyangiaceae bacterium]
MARTVRVALEELREGEHPVTGDPARYLTRVLRLREGARFTAFDPAARVEAEATLLAVERERVLARFERPSPASVVGSGNVTLIQCAGKGDKVDEVVRAATALGAGRIVIATSERSVARGTATSERSARLNTIALDAARQSGRGDLPLIEGPLVLADLLGAARENTALKLCLEPTAERPFGQALGERGGRPLVVLIGPEGGFSDAERDAAEHAGFALVRLGALVLRTELAAVAVLGALLATE